MQKKSEFSLEQLAQLTGSLLEGDPKHLITGVADLESATPADASFLSHPKYSTTRYRKTMETSHAGVICISPLEERPQQKNYLITDDPTLAFQKIINAIKSRALKLTGFTGIHPSAVIHPMAILHPSVEVGPNAVIDEGVVIAEHTKILPGVSIGPYTSIGQGCLIHANVTIREACEIGNFVIIQPGAVIGSCGFGYATDLQKGIHEKLDHVGNVQIGDHVEIGANTTIDRARFKSTIIGKGTKLDNLVLIAHNVQLGVGNLIAGQSAVAGSTKIGNYVVIAGQAGVDGHLKIGDHIILSARSGLSKSLKVPGKYGGAPAIPLAEYNRLSAKMRRIDQLIERVCRIEKHIEGSYS